MRLVYTRRATEDLIRLTDFLAEKDAVSALETVGLIEEALTILERHPLIGRKVDDRMRELVISRGSSGYVALYSFLQHSETILVLAIRHQREAGVS